MAQNIDFAEFQVMTPYRLVYEYYSRETYLSLLQPLWHPADSNMRITIKEFQKKLWAVY